MSGQRSFGLLRDKSLALRGRWESQRKIQALFVFGSLKKFFLSQMLEEANLLKVLTFVVVLFQSNTGYVSFKAGCR